MKLKTLADDLLVFVECDQMSDDVREDLFMPSRDRLTENDFKGEMIDCLEQALQEDETLRQLRNQRQQERMTDEVKDDKPLAEVLRHLIKSSPNLTALLQLGQRITAPFNTTQPLTRKSHSRARYTRLSSRSRGRPTARAHKRDCPINYRMRLAFETDARDDYFLAAHRGGKFSLALERQGWQGAESLDGRSELCGADRRPSWSRCRRAWRSATSLPLSPARRTRVAEFENRIDVTFDPAAEHREAAGQEKDGSPENKTARKRPRAPAPTRQCRRSTRSTGPLGLEAQV